MMTKEPGHVCAETENIVSSCHVASELDQKMIPRKCSEVCGDFEGLYEYHCMRDSLKTNFIAICAIPKRLFDYCPEYDRKGKRIQMDMTTTCNIPHTSPRYYNSSDISFCDPKRCLKLIEKRVNTTGTNITKEVPPNNEGGNHQNWISKNWYYVLLSVLGIVLLLLCVKFRKILSRKNSTIDKDKKRRKLQEIDNLINMSNHREHEEDKI